MLTNTCDTVLLPHHQPIRKLGVSWSHALQPCFLTWLLKMLCWDTLGSSGFGGNMSHPIPWIPLQKTFPAPNSDIFFCLLVWPHCASGYLNWTLVTVWKIATTRKLRRGTWVFSELWWAKHAFSGRTQLCGPSDSCWWADGQRADPWDTGSHPASNSCPWGLHPPEHHHHSHSGAC